MREAGDRGALLDRRTEPRVRRLAVPQDDRLAVQLCAKTRRSVNFDVAGSKYGFVHEPSSTR